MVRDYKIEDLEFACGVADERVRDVARNLAEYCAQVEKLKRKYLRTTPGSKERIELQNEYEDALDEQHNLECYVERITAERDHLYAELKRIINES